MPTKLSAIWSVRRPTSIRIVMERIECLIVCGEYRTRCSCLFKFGRGGFTCGDLGSNILPSISSAIANKIFERKATDESSASNSTIKNTKASRACTWPGEVWYWLDLHNLNGAENALPAHEQLLRRCNETLLACYIDDDTCTVC